ncbi:hypothetical protein RhiJN_04773 [Ceratobasidium sp. AG-Ba]|nr:hypothetical protein RhiJN_04773 [Ceratobasidium sp. AG-Ba]
MQLTDNFFETESQVGEAHLVERQIARLHIDQDDTSDSASETEVGDQDGAFTNDADENLVGEPRSHGRHHHRRHHSHHRHSRNGHHHASFLGFNTDDEPIEGHHHPHRFEGFEGGHCPGHYRHPHPHYPHHHLPPFPPPFGLGMFGAWCKPGLPPPPHSENAEGPVPPPEGPWMMGDRRGRGGVRGMHHHEPLAHIIMEVQAFTTLEGWECVMAAFKWVDQSEDPVLNG